MVKPLTMITVNSFSNRAIPHRSICRLWVVILNALQTLMERNGQPAGGDAPHNHSSATGGGAGSAPATQALSSPHYLFVFLTNFLNK
uniref:Uncharacterized protein n=1 Tax=Globodera pallida TaxID=36090 RepID=A0A183BJG1_GLOPA